MTTPPTAIQSISPANAFAAPSAVGVASPMAAPMSATVSVPPTTGLSLNTAPAAPSADQLDQQRIRPNPPSDTAKYRLTHPKLYLDATQVIRQQSETRPTPGETTAQQTAMFFNLYDQLDDTGRTRMKNLLNSGKLLDNTAEDGHSTLYHLYAMASTPRLNGLDGKRCTADMLRIMDAPETIVQTFVNLLPQHAQRLLQQFNLHPSDLPQGKNSISTLDYLQAYSADCVPAAIMARQAIRHPAELSRQINEITGLGYFNETVTASELWPKNPAEAEAVMKEWQWAYQPVAGQPGTYKVRFITPDSVKLRMVAAHTRNVPGKEQSPIEGGYQGTLAYQGAAHQYNGLLGKRWDPSQNLSIGLNAIEKTVLENAIADGKSINTVQYQIATGKNTSDDGSSYLFGYTVPFEETAKHLKLSVDLGWHPVVGFVETDSTGKIDMAHEVLVTGYTLKGGQLYFEVIDTDDDNPQKVYRAAREFIPKLHHASYPFGMAQRIEDSINQHFQQFFVPSAEDRGQFDTITISPEQPMNGWEEMVWPDIVQQQRKQLAQAAAPNAAPNLTPNVSPTPVQVPTPLPTSSPVITPPVTLPSPDVEVVNMPVLSPRPSPAIAWSPPPATWAPRVNIPAPQYAPATPWGITPAAPMVVAPTPYPAYGQFPVLPPLPAMGQPA